MQDLDPLVRLAGIIERVEASVSTLSRISKNDYLSAQYAAEASIVHSRSGSAR